MQISQERAAIAAHDIDRRARTQTRERPAQWRSAEVRTPGRLPRAPAPAVLVSQALDLNQQQSAMQSAQGYLGRLSVHLSEFKRDLGRALGGSASNAPDAQSIGRSIARLNELLDSRSRPAGASLDAQLQVNFAEPQRSRFSLKGLETLQGVQASGSETLLFSAGRHLPGPMAVVLDEHMSDAQTLRRFNVGLAQAGVHVELGEGGRLRFSAPEGQWHKLKGQIAVQGEDKLFGRGAFTPLASQEENLLGTPLPTTQEGRGELRSLLEVVNQGLQRVEGVSEQLRLRQAQALEQLGRQESKAEKRWVHDFAASVFAGEGQLTQQYSRVAQVVLAQASVSRHSVLRLLG